MTKQHVGRGGRRGGVVRRVGKLLAQLQVVQNEAVAVVGYAEAVRGFAVRGSSEVGADPGGQPRARVRALRKLRPVQRAQRGVNPVEVAAPVRPADDGRLDGDGGAARNILTLRVDQRGAGEQLLAQEAERRSHRLLSPEQNALRSASRTFRSSASGSRRKGNCRVPASPARTTGRIAG